LHGLYWLHGVRFRAARTAVLGPIATARRRGSRTAINLKRYRGRRQTARNWTTVPIRAARSSARNQW